MIRILRIFKVLKVFRSSAIFMRITELMKLNEAMVKLMKMTATMVLMIHLSACFWYMFAKFDNFNPDTWVVRRGIQDESNFYLYITCIYWSLQTLTTVGFGDVGAYTVTEKLYCLAWMIFGVGIYSFTFGNLSALLISLNEKA